MNKQELQNEINKTKEQLARLQEVLKDEEYKRWQPKHQEKYYIVDTYNEVNSCRNYTQAVADKHMKVFNCFQTREEANAEAEKILIRRQLEDIAKRLNKGEKIDWNNYIQNKFYIDFNKKQGLSVSETVSWKSQGTVYCLDANFLDIAIEEIGKERLLNYLKGE